jgi:aminopeptidase N
VTLIWPYHCGNVFPCHTDPGDGMVFDLQLENVPEGQVAIFPDRIETDAPSYMLAWAVGNYGHEALGATSAGTRVNVFWLPGGKTNALAGTRHLTEVFDWLERTLGPYAFGHEVGSVSAKWGAGALGGMEHHPFWHVADEAMDDEETHAHEAAHGWYGDGVRIRCWEDFVLSEGTVSYLAARALGQVAGEDVEKEVWEDYQQRLEDAGPASPGRTAATRSTSSRTASSRTSRTCAAPSSTRRSPRRSAPRRSTRSSGASNRDHRGQAAGFFDILVAIENETGFDAGPLAMKWLRTR